MCQGRLGGRETVGPALIFYVRHDTAWALVANQMALASARLRLEYILFIDGGES